MSAPAPSTLPEVPLRVLLDVRHPLAYLALHPTLAFARARNLHVDWLPLAVPTLHPPSEAAPGDDRGIRHRRHRARALAREVRTYALSQGLSLREPYREAPADALNLAWLWLRDQHPERLADFLVRSFGDYWRLELDADSRPALARLLGTLGADADAFLDWCEPTGVARAAEVAESLRNQGLFQVPAFLVEDQVFYGRQHLPMIGWILEGRSGPVPI